MIDWKKSSKLLPSWLPEFVREDAPLFVAFMAAYYEWADSQGNPSYEITNFAHNRDIDLAEDRLLTKFADEFMVRIPQNVLADKRLLTKHIKQFYRAKGTEKAVRFLFRILYNTEIDFYYPSRDIWRLDSSQWQIDRSLIISPTTLNPLDGLYQEVSGSISGARTRIESMISYLQDGALVYEMFYNRSISEFIVGDDIICKDSGDVLGKVLPSGVKTYPGRYVSFNSHIDKNKRLQDDYYYQAFSYVIKSNIPLSTYEQIVGDLVEPAGAKLFGEYRDSFKIEMQPRLASDARASLYVPSKQQETFDYTSSLNLGVTIASTDLAESVEENVTYTSYTQAQIMHADVFKISNSGSMLPYVNRKGIDFANWRGEDFTNGKGVIGVGTTNFNDFLSRGMNVRVIDNTNTLPLSYNEIKAVDSGNTAVLVFPCATSLANASFYV